MSYDARRPSETSASAGSLTSTGVTSTVMLFEPGRVWRFAAYVTTAVVSTGNVVVQLLYRPVAGSATNQVVILTLNIPGGALVDTVYYKDIPANVPQSLGLIPAGSQLAYNVQTAAAGGGAAGAAVFEFLADFSPDVVLDESKFILST